MLALLLVGWLVTPAPLLWSAIIAGVMLWSTLTPSSAFFPSAPARNEILARAAGPPPPLASDAIFLSITQPWRSMRFSALSTGGRVRAGCCLNGKRRRMPTSDRGTSNAGSFWHVFGFRPCAWFFSRRRLGSRGPSAMVAVGPFLILVGHFSAGGDSDQSPCNELARRISDARMIANSCAPQHDEHGDTSRISSVLRLPGCRRTTCRKRMRGKFSCARRLRTSGFGCSLPSRRTILATSRSTISSRGISARSKPWVGWSGSMAISSIGMTSRRWSHCIRAMSRPSIAAIFSPASGLFQVALR